MHLIVISLMVFLVWSTATHAAAQSIDYTPVIPRGGQNLTTEIQGELDNKIGGLIKKVARLDVDIAGFYREFKTDTLQVIAHLPP